MRDSMKLQVRRLLGSAVLPTRSHEEDAGLDLYAAEDLVIPAGEARTVRTGIAIGLPSGTEGQVRPRSGLAQKYSVTVLNAPGTIDEGYRGEICVILINHGRSPFRVTSGMKLAQLVVQPRLRVDLVEVETLTDTARGAAGFGSTGE